MALFNRSSSGKLWVGRGADANLQEINLREEFHNLLFGTSSMPQRGHWIVYRRFDTSQYIDGYDEVYHVGPQASGSTPRDPIHPYTDTFVMTRQDPIVSPEMAESYMPAGVLKTGQYIFYFEYDVRPSENDQIYDIDWDDMRIKPPSNLLNNRYLKKYNIKEVFPYRGDGGRIEYWICHVNWDLIHA